MRTEYEQAPWRLGQLVVGIDEAGRGPLAGPCLVCGVVFPIGYENDAINDSKQLSARKRDQLADVIRHDALAILIERVEADEIDRLNIYEATKQAMIRIALASGCQYVLSDAMKLPLDLVVEAIVKGDQKSVSIAAASIIAKTERDAIMLAYDAVYPEYGFAQHKGYGTKQHIAALAKFGPTPIHRQSFHVHQLEQMTLDLGNK